MKKGDFSYMIQSNPIHKVPWKFWPNPMQSIYGFNPCPTLGHCCGREAQCGRRTKINWTKTAHNTRICMRLRTPRPLWRHTHAHSI